MLYHWDEVRHEEWSEGYTLRATQGSSDSYDFRQVEVVVILGIDRGIVGNELETGWEGQSAGAVIKQLVTKGDIWQEGGGVVDLLNGKSHHLEQMIACQEEWLSVKSAR